MKKIIFFCLNIVFALANEFNLEMNLTDEKALKTNMGTAKSLYCLGIIESIHIDSFRKIVEELTTFEARDRNYEFFLDINTTQLLVRKNPKSQFIYKKKKKNTYYNSTERSLLKYDPDTLGLLEIRSGKIEIKYECELAEDVLRVRQ